MPSLLTPKYQSFLAQAFLGSFGNTSQNVYIFIGHPQVWLAANSADIDSTPPAPVNDVQSQTYENWRDLLGIKRVPQANTQLVIARVNWATDTIYDQYDDQDTGLYAKHFYVLDTTGSPPKVYKCLWNHYRGVSNVAPSIIGTNVDAQATADGYVWQYMYTIGSAFLPFLTTSWMPVLANADVQTNALSNSGRLPIAVPLVVEHGGAGYSPSITTVPTIAGDGSAATIANSGVTITAGAVSSVVLSTGGSGFSVVTAIDIDQTPSPTSSAVLRAIIPPYPNHGFDPASELGAHGAMVATKFEYSEGGALTTVNNYRRAGVLVNPLLADGTVANADFYKQTWDGVISSNSGVLQPDDVIYKVGDTDVTAIVVDVQPDGCSVPILRLTRVFDNGEDTPFALGDVLHCSESGVEVTLGVVTPPELKFFSGDIIFTDQRVPITRGPSQTEEIKLVFTLS